MAHSTYFCTTMRYSGLLIGCLATGMAYSMDAFNVYADAIKDLFQYNQSQVELIISLANVGLLSSLPTGLLIPLFGFRVLSFIGLIISTGSYVLLCVATYNVPYFAENSFLIAIFFFFSGVGGGIMYITATTVNIRNFDMHHLGIVSGLLHSVKSAVLGVIMITYTAGFAGTTTNVILNSTLEGGVTSDNDTDKLHAQDPYVQHANLTGYFAFIAISYAIVNLLGMIFYGNYPTKTITFIKTLVFKPSEKHGHKNKNPEQQELIPKGRERRETEHEEDILSRSSCSIKVVRTLSMSQPGEVRYSPMKLMKSYYYHAILWPSVFLIAYRTCYINNLTGFTKAMGTDKNAEAVLVSMIPIMGTVVKPVLGIASDALSRKVPRSASLLSFLLLNALASILCMTLFSHVSVITIGLIVALFGSCAVQTQSPAILVETFSKECFSYGWGFITLAWSLCTMSFQMMYGKLYDEQVLPNGGNYCYGQHCFTSFFAICGSLAVVIAFVVVYAVVKQIRELRARNYIESRLSQC